MVIELERLRGAGLIEIEQAAPNTSLASSFDWSFMSALDFVTLPTLPLQERVRLGIADDLFLRRVPLQLPPQADGDAGEVTLSAVA